MKNVFSFVTSKTVACGGSDGTWVPSQRLGWVTAVKAANPSHLGRWSVTNAFGSLVLQKRISTNWKVGKQVKYLLGGKKV